MSGRRGQRDPERSGRADRTAYVLLLIPPLLWAGNFVVGRGIHGDIPPVALTFWRWVVAACVLLPLAGGATWRARASVRREWRLLIVLALTGVVGFQYVVYQGLRSTTAINGVLIIATVPAIIPLFAYGLDGVRRHRAPDRRHRRLHARRRHHRTARRAGRGPGSAPRPRRSVDLPGGADVGAVLGARAPTSGYAVAAGAAAGDRSPRPRGPRSGLPVGVRQLWRLHRGPAGVGRHRLRRHRGLGPRLLVLESRSRGRRRQQGRPLSPPHAGVRGIACRDLSRRADLPLPRRRHDPDRRRPLPLVDGPERGCEQRTCRGSRFSR